MYIEATDENGQLVFERGIQGPVTMLNLLRFRRVADYSQAPHLAPPEPVSGRDAYDRYVAETLPLLSARGGSIVWQGSGGHFLIGPVEERWDLAMLVRHESLQALMDMADDPAFQAVIGHRTAALEDSRLLPLVDV